MAAGRILGQDSYLQHRKYQKPPGSLPVLIFSTYTQYRPIRHRLFTDTPRTDLSDTCSSQIHPVHSYQTPAIHRYTQYRPIRHLLFTDTPSTFISDTCSSQIHPVHSYQTPSLRRYTLSHTSYSQIHPVHSYLTPALHRYTLYIYIRHRLFTDTPCTFISDTVSSQIHHVHSYQTPALHRYTLYIHIRYRLFTDTPYQKPALQDTPSTFIFKHLLITETPSTFISDTLSSQIHPVHSYKTPSLHRYTLYTPTVPDTLFSQMHSTQSASTY